MPVPEVHEYLERPPSSSKELKMRKRFTSSSNLDDQADITSDIVPSPQVSQYCIAIGGEEENKFEQIQFTGRSARNLKLKGTNVHVFDPSLREKTSSSSMRVLRSSLQMIFSPKSSNKAPKETSKTSN